MAERRNATEAYVAAATKACQGRLTLTPGVPVTTADVIGAGTIYFTPFRGNHVALYNGSAWVGYTFTERSLALAVTSGKNYDVFLYDNAGTLTLELSAPWTNDTTRADAIALQDGVYVKSGAPTRRLVGTIRASGTNTTEDSGGGTTTQVGGKRFVWNAYNRVKRTLLVIDTTNNWAYGTDTWRQAGGVAGNKVEYVAGLSEDAVEAHTYGIVYAFGNALRAAKVGVGLDSTTAASGLVQGGFNAAGTGLYAPISAHYEGWPGIGYHALNWLERGADGTSTFLGDNGGDGQQSGVFCQVLA